MQSISYVSTALGASMLDFTRTLAGLWRACLAVQPVSHPGFDKTSLGRLFQSLGFTLVNS